MPKKTKKKTPPPAQETTPYVPDAIDQIIIQADEIEKTTGHRSKLIITVFAPLKDTPSGEVGISTEIEAEDVSAVDRNGEKVVQVDIGLSKEQVIELYKVVTGTHPEIKSIPHQHEGDPLQLR